MKVVVVGAGVIGSSIAFHLAQDGAEVTVVDGGLSSASQTSFGWINASFYADRAHHNLRRASMAAYARLLAQALDLPVRMDGAVWFENGGAAMDRMEQDLHALGYPVERIGGGAVTSDVQGLPNEVLRFPTEGAAEVSDLAARLMQLSAAQIISGVSVTDVLETAGHVTGVMTSVGPVLADRVVIAAGTGTTGILQSVGVRLPMLTRPGVLVTTTPVSAKINGVLVTPHGELRQLPDGSLLASAVANHQGDEASHISEPLDEIAARVLRWVEPMIDVPLGCARVALAYRPVPQDGLPVIGQVGPKGLNVAVMHSGVTLAAITGEAMAAEVLGRGEAFEALLAPYRPSRFQ